MFMFLPENSKIFNLNLLLTMKKGAHTCERYHSRIVEQKGENLAMRTNDR